MRNLTEANLTNVVLSRLNCSTPRQTEIITKLINHLHAFIRDLEPTEAEWFQAIDFLTRTGQKCDDKRQEFILLSDVLGVSMLVDAINHRFAEGTTETTVTGPFHAPANQYEMGANIARGEEAKTGEPTLVRGKVLGENGQPLAGVKIDVWQSNDDGHYDVTDPNMPEMNLRGVFTTDETGEFWFRTIKPASYPVPTDGPVGELLRASGRHPMRPAHIHFWVEAEGYQTLITHIFVEGDEYLESDAVFGVKESLILEFKKNENKEEAAKWDIEPPFYEAVYDFTLAKKMTSPQVTISQ
ncbi:MAG TPA: 6-chlorohydroxyquinol-1,2-dioxygenase [Microscillaceae bacterium]|nr:6-chlorohydroxyquinol-1,2-dioxygenase [Microscillaceae bacterium]